jgi:uncharacterized protein
LYGFTSWEQALDVATRGAESPSIIVIDELPWLIEMDDAIEELLQRVWDRVLRKRPVLVVLIGSDLAMMDALTEYGRPLFDRAAILRIDPLTPSDVVDLTGLSSADAIEAWSREHSKIAQRSGLVGSSLERALGLLIKKQAVIRERPYSTEPSRLTHYCIADAHLRVWGRYVAANMPAIERGAGAAAIEAVLADWTAWKGQAVEPIVRESVLRLSLRDKGLAAAAEVGRWWRRDGRTEVDLVIGDRTPIAKSVLAVGSIKWRQKSALDWRDVQELATAASAVPGYDGAPLFAVSRVAGTVDGLSRVWTPDDLIGAWR